MAVPASSGPADAYLIKAASFLRRKTSRNDKPESDQAMALAVCARIYTCRPAEKGNTILAGEQPLLHLQVTMPPVEEHRSPKSQRRKPGGVCL
jgi:hypothetical protein